MSPAVENIPPLRALTFCHIVQLNAFISTPRMEERFHLLSKWVNANDDFEIRKLLRNP